LKAILCNLFILLVAQAAGALSTAQARTPPDQLSVRVWQVKDGLPQNQVRAVRQTRDGYVWVATYDGLARFDGTRFVVFNRENTPALRSNIFTSLYEDRAGTLWIGSDGGLVRYSNGQFTAYTTAQGLAADTVTGIAEARDGALFVAAGNALHVMRDGNFDRFAGLSLPIGRSIRQLYATRAGDVWLTTNAGGFRIGEGGVRRYTVRDGLSTDNLNAITEDRQGGVWFGAIGEGLIRWREGKFENYPIRPGLPDNIVYALTEDASGRLWAGTHAGLYQFSDGRLSGFTQRNGLPSDFVTALCTDHEGSLWAGTDGGGLARVRDSGVRVFTRADGLAGDFVRSIAEGRDGAVWIAAWFGDGISLLRGGQFGAVGKNNPLLKNGVRAMLEDRRGVLWLATASNQLVSFQDGVFSAHLSPAATLPPIFSLAEDKQGRLWLGRSDGLWLFEDGRLTSVAAEAGTVTAPVRVIIESGAGGLWAGTDSGLLRYLNGTLRVFTERDGLPYPFVSGLYEDADGTLWVGTRGGGLSRFKNGVITTITMKHGLPSDAVYQMLEDDQQNLWCGGSRGVFRVSRAELNQLAERRINRLTSVTYGQTEGMQRSVHFGTHPSACRTRDGKLWFPTLNGLMMIEPGKLRLNVVPPSVVIEQAMVDKRAFAAAAEVVAPPGGGEVEIQYAGLSFVAPERVSFRYRLEGLQPEWVDAGTRRTAYFTNVPPGNYTFRVLAGNNDGVWNEAGATIRLRLRPHFYQTWWFFAGCLIAVTTLGWLVHRQRLRQMQARHAAVMGERNRIARDIHDTLAQEVAGLLAQLHVIKTLLPGSPQNAGRHLERAVELARTGLADARRLVLDLRHQALEHDDLATALENFIAQVSDEDAPTVSYQIKGAPRRLAQEQENNLLRIGQESVNNALRHARARTIEVNLSFESKMVELIVRDDGCGFDPALHAQGFGGHYGLLGIRERAAQIGGELSLSSAPGAGAEIKVRVKTGAALKM
jgi:ligand-binding sensor domain-containing protein/signal transduction histidine kinase